MENLKTINDYEIIDKLGRGQFGMVYKAKRNTDGKLIALKVIDVNPGDEKLVEVSKKEVQYLKELSTPSCNPFVICYYGSHWNPDTRQFFIEMEYIDGKEMFDFVLESRAKNNPEVHQYLLLLIAKDLAQGLKYIHSNNVLHNDIKLENIMIDGSYTPRIIDFGLSCNAYKGSMGKYCQATGGTPWYIAPEFFSKKTRTPGTDMWALGVTLYTAAMGKYPYDVDKGPDAIQRLFNKIIYEEPTTLNTNNTQLNNIVNGLLNKNPDNRYTADDVIRKLQIIPKPRAHPFIPRVTPRTSQDITKTVKSIPSA